MMSALLRLNHALLRPREQHDIRTHPIRPDSELGSALLVATASAAAMRSTAGPDIQSSKEQGFNKRRRKVFP